MKYDLIFYLSRKTGYCEKRLSSMLAAIDGQARKITSAREPTTLGDCVCKSLQVCPLVIIIGGLRSADDDNLSVVLSRVMSNSRLTLENMRKITAPSGATGYIIRCKGQILLALPDEPEDIEQMLSGSLLAYLRDKTTA